MKFLSSIILVLTVSTSFAQTKSDSIKVLNEVTVQAYGANKDLIKVPASVALVKMSDFARFSPVSVVSAFNTQPGVRMEERSPGSYRFAIRGSSLRSSFGVRNVKFYWNSLPLSDGGGNTYLNLIDLSAIGSAEVIKGPGGSLYGAGTGGIVLLNSTINNPNSIQLSATGGSFGFQRYQTNISTNIGKAKIFLNYAHQQADGYRQQSSMKRDAFNLEGKVPLSEKNSLRFTSFYTDLYYQTPGALKQTEYDTDPSRANPSAVSKKTSIENKTIYNALNDDHQWNSKWSSRIGFYYSYTDFTNPAVNNYERRLESNWGGRTDTQYEFGNKVKGKLTFGAELQNFSSPLTDYDNNAGVMGNVQTDDQLNSTLTIAFAQTDFEFAHELFVTAGGSMNFLNYQFTRLVGTQSGNQTRNFDAVFSPRLAVLKKVNNVSFFGSVSKGFSPPSLAEVRPSAGVYNNSLSPEFGTNYEAGVRGHVFKNFSFDMIGYDFELDQAIVSQKQLANNADYFINAGSTSQKGVELFISWQKNFNSTFNSLKIWSSAAFMNYKFVDYQKDGISYSGNWLTGSPGKTVAGGIDLNLLQHFYVNTTLNYVDRTPLNDLSSIYASDYFLVGTRIGYRINFNQRQQLEIFCGVDNALDQKYSLGNDLNSAPGRYFNAAAPRNYYFGLRYLISRPNP